MHFVYCKVVGDVVDRYKYPTLINCFVYYVTSCKMSNWIHNMLSAMCISCMYMYMHCIQRAMYNVMLCIYAHQNVIHSKNDYDCMLCLCALTIINHRVCMHIDISGIAIPEKHLAGRLNLRRIPIAKLYTYTHEDPSSHLWTPLMTPTQWTLLACLLSIMQTCSPLLGELIVSRYDCSRINNN